MQSLDLWEYTSEEIRSLAPERILIQPIGAVEQHGLHLPLGTDSMIISAFVQRLKERFVKEGFPALFLPLMPYGKSIEHLEFPGTITYSTQTFMSVLMDIGRSCARVGAKKLVFLNGHGGNHEVLDLITRELRIDTGMQVFALHPLLKIMPETREEQGCQLSEAEAKLGIHAGRIETAVIMATHPELVHMDRAVCDYPTCFDQLDYIDFSEKVPFGWMTQDVSKTGGIGDPTGSTPAEGEKWLSSVTTALYHAFVDIQRLPLPAGSGSAGK